MKPFQLYPKSLAHLACKSPPVISPSPTTQKGDIHGRRQNRFATPLLSSRPQYPTENRDNPRTAVHLRRDVGVLPRLH